MLLAGTLAAVAAVAVADAPLPPSLSVDTAFYPPTGIARDGGAGTGTDIPGGVAVDGERIYVVGESDGDVAIIARHTNGTYDAGFGDGGRLDIALGDGRDVGIGIAVLPDHRLRILASTDADPSSSTNTDVALIGLGADGSDDESFGDHGRVTFAVGPIDDAPSRMSVDADGRIAIAGRAKDANGKEDSFIALLRPDGSRETAFGEDGIRTLDRAGDKLNDRAVDVAFRPGGLLALLQVATDPDTNVNAYQSVLHAFTNGGADDPAFSEDGDLVLSVGEPNTIPGALLAYGGRFWATGSTKVGTDTDAWIARVEADGSGLQSRRFDMRGTQIDAASAVVSGGGDLAVLDGLAPSLVVVGSTTYNARTLWSAAVFNAIDGDLAQAGFGDLLIPTDEYGALLGVAAGDGWLAATGSLLNVEGSFDTSFGTVRLLVDADKTCDLEIAVPEPLEIVFERGRAAGIKVTVTNKGTKACAGAISVSAPYELRHGGAGGPIATGVLGPGQTFTTDGATVAYSGRLLREDALTIRVTAAGDTAGDNDSKLVRVVFSYCDVQLRGAGALDIAPNEGSRRYEFSVRNVGTATCSNVRLAAGSGVRAGGAVDTYSLRAGRSASDDMLARVARAGAPGRTVALEFRALADGDANPDNDVARIAPVLVGVGDTAARAPTGRRLSGTARPGKGPRMVAKKRLRVTRVDVALRRSGGCRWLASASGRFRGGRDRGCKRQVWLRARGTRRWRLDLEHALPPGRYVLYSRATIAAGFREASFSARDGNRVAFRVR